MMGKGATGKQDEEGKNVSGANAAERLRTTDFSKINEIDAKQLEQISDQLFKEMTVRLRRRMQQSKRRGQINLRRTIRKSLNYGGEAIDLSYRAKKPKKQRLIVLLDVSGSMDKYSFFLLRFLFALREHFRQMEAFIFSTKLIPYQQPTCTTAAGNCVAISLSNKPGAGAAEQRSATVLLSSTINTAKEC
jgi:uncharacterized protein with von Willebrand factor type A (vWA) domain